MKVQQMPSNHGKVSYFVYLPLEYCEALKIEKGTKLYPRLDKDNDCIILGRVMFEG